MVQSVIKDEAFLQLVSEPARAEDLSATTDLLDTLKAHADGCFKNTAIKEAADNK